MPRYFFDIHGLHHDRDDDGVDLADIQTAAKQAKRLIPQIAMREIPNDGERQVITVLVTDEDGHPVYSAAMTFVGLWLIR
ncbi:DUF6894 family protein [Methylobacterium flocculans]|uniref:DUF6894 family protein n=1 Tax=Methylobacterium flocculans TaxID=2984843 RepID=UPI00384F2B90